MGLLLTLMLLRPRQCSPYSTFQVRSVGGMSQGSHPSLFVFQKCGSSTLPHSSALTGSTPEKGGFLLILAPPEVHLSKELNLSSLEGPSSARHPCFHRAPPPQIIQRKGVPARAGAPEFQVIPFLTPLNGAQWEDGGSLLLVMPLLQNGCLLSGKQIWRLEQLWGGSGRI